MDKELEQELEKMRKSLGVKELFVKEEKPKKQKVKKVLDNAN